MQRGMCYEGLKDYKKAFEEYKKSLSEDENEKSYLLIACLYLKIENF